MAKVSRRAMLAATLTMAAAGAAAGASAGEARGDDDGGGGGARDGLPPSVIRIDAESGGLFRPTGMVITVRGSAENPLGADYVSGAYYIPFRKPAERRDENKADFGKIPFLGRAFRQDTTSDRFENARPVGEVYLREEVLEVEVMPAPDDDPAFWIDSLDTVVIANRNVSYWVQDTPVPVEEPLKENVPLLGATPVLGRLFSAGSAFRQGRELLVIVRPSNVEVEE